MKIRKNIESQGMHGVITVPGDKSISHRAVMLGSLANGITHIDGFLPGQDCLSTIDCFRKLGVEIEQNGSSVVVHGVGLNGLRAPQTELYVGNSGTTIRLLTGVLTGQKFSAILTGDESICRRPMNRVIKPLEGMGANIKSEGGFAPLHILPVDKLTGIDYELPIASAQVKSAILLAGLYADGVTVVTEPRLSRDHTELMLQMFGADIKRRSVVSSAINKSLLSGRDIIIPGDISAAAFIIVAALLVPGSDITIINIGLNPTRMGIIDVLRDMGGNIEIIQRNNDGEPIGDIRVKYSTLQGIEIAGEVIPRLIDELPVIVIAATAAEGKTIIRDAAELRVKESDRIKAMVNGLERMGSEIVELPDGMIISGGKKLSGAAIDSGKDHRIAMAFAVAGLCAEGETIIADDECVSVSFPGFCEQLSQLGAWITKG